MSARVPVLTERSRLSVVLVVWALQGMIPVPPIERSCIRVLKSVLEACGGKLVLTGWRGKSLRAHLLMALNAEGIAESAVLGDTPITSRGADHAADVAEGWHEEDPTGDSRANSIQEWLKSNTAVTNFVVLDDSCGAEKIFPGRVVLTQMMASRPHVGSTVRDHTHPYSTFLDMGMRKAWCRLVGPCPTCPWTSSGMCLPSVILC
jgi:hypothetical protein